jgi:hypothetical protein
MGHRLCLRQPRWALCWKDPCEVGQQCARSKIAVKDGVPALREMCSRVYCCIELAKRECVETRDLIH